MSTLAPEPNRKATLTKTLLRHSLHIFTTNILTCQVRWGMHLSYQILLTKTAHYEQKTRVLRLSFSTVIRSVITLYAGRYIAVSNLNHPGYATPGIERIAENGALQLATARDLRGDLSVWQARHTKELRSLCRRIIVRPQRLGQS